MQNIINSKICSKCNTLKNLIQFRTQKQGKYGKRASCISCDDRRQKEYFILNPQKKEERNKQRKQYFIENKILINIKAREKYHKIKVLKLDPNRIKIKDRYKEYNNENRKKWINNNYEKWKIVSKEYREKNLYLNARISIAKLAKIPYKETKNFMELVELKKLQLDALKLLNTQLDKKPKKL